MSKLCIHNALVVSGTDVKQGGVIVDDRGKIAKITAPDEKPISSDNVIDAEGCLLFAGFIDAHVHMREPGAPNKESYDSGTRSAACGGVTTVMCMPNTDPPVTDINGFWETRRAAEGFAYVDFCIQAGINVNSVDNIQSLWEAGVTSFEAFLSDASDSDMLAISDFLSLATSIAEINGVLGVYSGSKELLEAKLRDLKKLNKGNVTLLDLARARDPLSEALGISTTVEVCRATRVKTVLRQTSTARGFIIARDAKKGDPDLPLAVEVTPHHLHLTEKRIRELSGFAYMIPPVRSRNDCEAAISALVDGTIDFVGSDHAPHQEEEKLSKDPWSVPGGVPGLDTIVPAVLDFASREIISYEDVARLLCERPASLFGIRDRKGDLKPGSDGDIVLVDPNLKGKITRDDILSKAKRSPFEGHKLSGRVVLTVLRGEIIAQNGEITGSKTLGSFVPRGKVKW